MVPEDARFAQQSKTNEDTLKAEAELAMKNKLFILEAQIAAEEEAGGGHTLIPIHMTPKPLLPGQQATVPKPITHAQARKDSRKINSRAIGLSNAHLDQFQSDKKEGGSVRFAKRGGFGGNR